MASLRLLAVAALCATVMFAAAFAGPATPEPAASRASAYALDGDVGPTRISAVARRAVTWSGGPTTAATGEVVNVFVSSSLPAETPQKWADFLASLTHGPELGTVTARMATLAEVQRLCGSRAALGCYGRREMISLGEPLLERGLTPEEVVRHEYGHHIAASRINAPWLAIDWGPKHWASAANICARAARGEVVPGDGGRDYPRNPGEAWAETYRVMDERKKGITTGAWNVVDPSFLPNEAALAAAERDVVQPWTGGRRVAQETTFRQGRKRVWWIPLHTPLDGQLSVRATLPRGGGFDVALVSGNRRNVIRRAEWTSQRAKTTSATVCGQRSMFVRVTQSGGAGLVRVTAMLP